jgi:hypothetical protein
MWSRRLVSPHHFRVGRRYNTDPPHCLDRYLAVMKEAEPFDLPCYLFTSSANSLSAGSSAVGSDDDWWSLGLFPPSSFSYSHRFSSLALTLTTCPSKQDCSNSFRCVSFRHLFFFAFPPVHEPPQSKLFRLFTLPAFPGSIFISNH